jgi:hypothetical protein
VINHRASEPWELSALVRFNENRRWLPYYFLVKERSETILGFEEGFSVPRPG